MTVNIFAVLLLAAALGSACSGPISFESATPRTPDRVQGRLVKPGGTGPFPALVLLHGCLTRIQLTILGLTFPAAAENRATVVPVVPQVPTNAEERCERFRPARRRG